MPNTLQNRQSQSGVSVRFLTRKALCEKLGLSPGTVYRLERHGDFPKRIVIGPRRVAWDCDQVEEWMRQRRDAGAKLTPVSRKGAATT
jgi:prophage regulatory protein